MGGDLRSRARDAAALLETLADSPRLLAELSEDERHRLVIAAGMVSRPDREAHRAMRKALRKKARDEVRRSDENILDATGIRAARRAPVFVAPPLLPKFAAIRAGLPLEPAPELNEARKCYVCKSSFTTVHPFYDQMCGPCAELNYRKRHQTFDLSGRYALVTGARVKIGFHAALKLLRAGCYVVVTTRFARDAAARYAREEDFESFRDRLEVFGLDLRHTPSVEAFCEHARRTLPRLDFIINNACQTVRRPSGFYKHLMEAELGTAPEHLRPLLTGHEELRRERADALVHALPQNVGLIASAEMSQLPLLPEDRGSDLQLFPEGRLDADLQQVDLRGRNSWRLTLAEVPSVELLEVQLVNAVAPFVLNARLKPLMQQVATRDKHVINVSAMEGQFYRAWKTDKHPHTNMAKAALNMMTRTSAPDYVKDGIHMNSVDTGWITDEDPVEIATRKVAEHGFEPPLDVVDGAARIVDPIFDGFLTGEHKWGLFLKDYAPAPW
jgi:NAD(P)-dependent dehydrogenase (short-subunit alcohol dehydrogenase family)